MKQMIIFLSFFFSLSAGAQSWQLFNMLVAQGNYTEARDILKVLENADKEMIYQVTACIELQKEAEALYQKEYYTKAIEKFRMIKSYFPSDNTVDAAIRQCEIKRDEYNRMLEHKRREEQARQAQTEEDTQWQKAEKLNTKIEYINYLSKYPYGRYRDLARGRLFGLYIVDARRNYYCGDYRGAVINFGIASKYGTLSTEVNRIYRLAKVKIAQQEEDSRYAALNYNVVSASSLEEFLRDYPQSKYCPEIRGKLLYRYCDIGRFTDAMELVENFPEGIASVNGTIQDSKWWMRYIRQRERNYSKASKKTINSMHRHRKLISFNMFGGLRIMLSTGASISYTSRKEMITEEYQGIMTEKEEVVGGAFLGPRLAFSVGDYNNMFNMEIGASYSYSGELGSQFPLAIGPRWNIVANGEAFHLYVQPEVGYDVIRNGMYYSGKVGIGCALGTLFFGVAYNQAVFDKVQYQIGYVYHWQWDV